MRASKFIVSEIDASRLRPHLEARSDDPPSSEVSRRLNLARIVNPVDVPPNVVTMNSRVVIQYPHGPSEDRYVLTYPDRDINGGMSVLSPLGAAVFAAREGEEVTFMGARTSQTVVVKAIEFQPEREGILDL